MPGIGGLKSFELGQVTQAIGDDTKKNVQIAKSQISGKPVQQRGTNDALIPQKNLDTGGDMGTLLEQNQTQQSIPSDPAAAQKQIQEKFAEQQKKDQQALDAARKNLEDLERRMKELRDARTQQEEQEEKVEERQKEQEEMWQKKQEEKQPISTSQRRGEVKGNKG